MIFLDNLDIFSVDVRLILEDNFQNVKSALYFFELFSPVSQLNSRRSELNFY